MWPADFFMQSHTHPITFVVLHALLKCFIHLQDQVEFYEKDQCVNCGDVLESFPGMSCDDRQKKKRNKQHAEEWNAAMDVHTGEAGRDWTEQDIVETLDQSADLISTF